jgi:uncharacterized protein (DUF2236 family)
METPKIPESLVGQDAIEELWLSVANRTSDTRQGIFGPRSISWKVDRESALFLGAGRAALLQLAHPWVAAALDQHSSLRADPLARFHGTFRLIFSMVFGTLDQALAASRHIHHLHTFIQGELPEAIAGYARGVHYAANELNALRWVYATLIESALLAYEIVLPPLSSDQRDGYYAETKTFAALFGIPADELPPDWTAFAVYTREMVASDSLGVNALSRELAHYVLQGGSSWIPVPRWYRALTASWMPERLRKEFALEYQSPEEAAANRARRWLPLVYRRLPGPIRFVGPYHEAQARLAGRKPGPLVHASNRFWMGQPNTMFHQPW